MSRLHSLAVAIKKTTTKQKYSTAPMLFNISSVCDFMKPFFVFRVARQKFEWGTYLAHNYTTPLLVKDGVNKHSVGAVQFLNHA